MRWRPMQAGAEDFKKNLDFPRSRCYTGAMSETPAVTKNQAFKETFQRGTVVFPVQYSLCNTVSAHYDLPLHWHEEYELIHVISGTYNIFITDKEYKLEKDDLCLIPGDLIHGDAQNKGMALYESVVFDLDVLRLHSY